jgi:DNA/RNA-binding domain of Phe-tRNA-synthetase-like protein
MVEAIIGDVTIDLADPGIAMGAAFARGCTVGPAPAGLEEALTSAIASAPDEEAVKKAVRDLLRHGKYKPTGRGKPACEYLLNAAREARFPRINNLVDINNLISLESQLPISLIDVTLAGTNRFRVRRGRAGEKYVFNSGGQEIELEDLLLVAHLPSDTPCANPVKDSMATKLIDASTDVLAVLYAPPSLRDRLSRATQRFAEALDRYSGGRTQAFEIITSG